jgi:hypothetical protein
LDFSKLFIAGERAAKDHGRRVFRYEVPESFCLTYKELNAVAIQSERVEVVDRVVADISVEVDAAVVALRVAGEEAAGDGIVVAIPQ